MALKEMLKEYSNRPITEKERESIKKEYSLNTDVTVPVGQATAEPMAAKVAAQPAVAQSPTEGTTAPMPQMPIIKEVSTQQLVPSYESIDLAKVRDQMKKVTREPSFTEYLPYLTPLVVEALFGGGESMGVSAGIAGKALLEKEAGAEKRLQTLEDKLMNMKALKSTVKYGTEMDKEAGKQARFEAAQKQKQEQKQKDIEIAAGARFQQKLDQDKVFQDYKNQASQSQRALELLSKGIGVADAGARTTFAKGIFGEVGNLAVQEQMAVSGSPMILQKFQSLWSKFTLGTLGDQDRADMVEVAAAIKQNAPKVLQRIAMERAKAEQSISGVDVSKIAQSLSRDNATGDVMIKVIYNGRIKNININDYPEAVRKYKAKLFTGKE